MLTELLSIINVAKEEVIEASEQTQQNKTETENLYNLTRSYAVGDTGTREGEETDNSKYYYTKCKDISDSIPGPLKPIRTVVFGNLPELSASSAGDMYNISNEFVTDERSKEGSGNIIRLGSNVYKTTDGFWDVLTGSPVTGIKGENEQTYRRGNVNVTKENIGLGNVPNVSTDNQAFTFTEAESDSELVSGEKANTIFGKLARIVKTVISLKEEVAGLNGKKMDTFFSPSAGIDLYDNGRYMCLSAKSNVLNVNDTNVANAIGSWCFVISFVQNDTGVQFITSLFSASSAERTIYKRSKTSGTWSKWSAINVTP